MTSLALALVLSAAFIHATWNFITKRVGGGPTFLWLFSVLSAILYLPFLTHIIITQRPHISGIEIIFIAGTTVLHLGYFLMLQRGYREGDLSWIYPLARGTGPTISTGAAILFFGERPSLYAMAGASLVVVGVFVLTGGIHILKKENIRKSLFYALATGSIIAGYTLWDKYAVSELSIPPLLLLYFSILGRIALLSPYVLQHRQEISSLWSRHRGATLCVAIFNPLSYILILNAMTFTPISYIAPARELSVLIAVIMGTGFLNEGHAVNRLIASMIIVFGMTLLALK